MFWIISSCCVLTKLQLLIELRLSIWGWSWSILFNICTLLLRSINDLSHYRSTMKVTLCNPTTWRLNIIINLQSLHQALTLKFCIRILVNVTQVNIILRLWIYTWYALNHIIAMNIPWSWGHNDRCCWLRRLLRLRNGTTKKSLFPRRHIEATLSWKTTIICCNRRKLFRTFAWWRA